MADSIHIKLPDGSVKEVPRGTTALDVAKSISPRLADAALAAKTNGDLVDLTLVWQAPAPIKGDQIVTMAVLPLVFIALPLAGLLAIKPGTDPDAIKAAVGSALLGFFLVPLMLPTVIAGYSVVGEREQGTLEPVLTTPVRREELLLLAAERMGAR